MPQPRKPQRLTCFSTGFQSFPEMWASNMISLFWWLIISPQMPSLKSVTRASKPYHKAIPRVSLRRKLFRSINSRRMRVFQSLLCINTRVNTHAHTHRHTRTHTHTHTHTHIYIYDAGLPHPPPPPPHGITPCLSCG